MLYKKDDYTREYDIYNIVMLLYQQGSQVNSCAIGIFSKRSKVLIVENSPIIIIIREIKQI